MRTVLALLAVAAAALLAGLTLPAAAQPKAKPERGADLRPIYATPQDVAEGRRLAESSCVRCHGANGISGTAGIPHLAGQRAGYLYQQLRNYGRIAQSRATTPMTGAVSFLSDDALVKVSAYFASLDPARPVVPAAVKGKAEAARTDPVQAGKAAAESCAGCHGETGVSSVAGMPSLIGFDPKYFIASMQAYKSGQRKHDMMKGFAAGVSDADVANMALFYALQKPARAQTPAPGDAAAGKAAAAGCDGCHGDRGVSTNPATPSLAGQDAEYLTVATLAYKDGIRNDEAMKGVVGDLDEKTTRNIAAYYAAQTPQAPANVRKPLTIAQWAERCDRCHGVNGNSTDPLMPAIAAQRADWLEQVLHAYRSGARKSSAMSAMSASMTDAEVKDVAAHYARQNARSVVFVVVPER